ncbi:Sir2 family protein [Rhizodiscina lignyota]|uniref:Sir2 family protein n=1 Tax=Rhizodiscina lignyota TaxID=1504668 RepID=A0A9P4I282_9PEZI|nr:Sir2 family protein [Rhizodiscina lignyota]
MPLMRIPYTDPLPAPRIIPSSAASTAGAVEALVRFLTSSPGELPAPSRARRHLTPPSAALQPSPTAPPPSAAAADDARLRERKTLLLTGAGVSVASGLADYRGTRGTYTLNKTYRPTYYHEFVARHDARKRYWARSFLGSANLERAKPNAAHYAIGELGRQGIVGKVITQNVDSFHPIAHPTLPTIELHGYLRTAVCLSCRREYPRQEFQEELARLNPPWAAFLQEMIASGALDTENPTERRRRGLKTNPDGDVDLGGGVDYSTFQYPACPKCLADPPVLANGERGIINVDANGAWLPTSTAGVLKPNVIMFGESISNAVKEAAEAAVDNAGKLLVIGSSLATYSAWRLAKQALELGLPIGILNMGGVRGEDAFFAHVDESDKGESAFRCAGPAEEILPQAVDEIEKLTGRRVNASETCANIEAVA